MKYCVIVITAGWLLSGGNAIAQDRPLPPREAPLRMTLPEGFKATLFAGEPDVVQPIAICFDHRGRLWVAECMSYPKWHTDLKEGRDRILIFEDTKGDGTFDKRTVFADKLANVTAIQVGFGGVFVGATPHLLFIPDRNGDDVPDGPPETLLDGFDIKAGHTVMNSLTWGPDGWLYGCHGIQATVKLGKPGTPDDKRAVLNCGVWRYHPTRKEVEAFAHGTTNPWGLDFDENGQMFITNCVIGHLWHVVPGAHFERMYGEDINPFSFGLLKTCADHQHWGSGRWTASRGGQGEHSVAGGGHAHVGCMIYLGDNFPDRYRNSVFMCNLHGNRINNDILERKGSTYVARHGKDFMFANDPWFRGLALCYGPDGGVYVCDWTDTGECHNYKVVDQTNGRIYKITYTDPRLAGSRRRPQPPAEKIDLSKLPDAKLVELQWHKNEWFVRTARRILQERAAAGTLAKETRNELESVFRLKSEERLAEKQLRALWALHVTGGIDAKSAADLLGATRFEALRTWAARLVFERPAVMGKFASSLAVMAFTEGSAAVRLELAAGLQRLPVDERWGLAEILATHGEDEGDPFLPLMIWYGAEPLVDAKPGYFAWDNPVALTKLAKLTLIKEYLARRMCQKEKVKQWQDLFNTLYQNDQPAFHRDVLRGIHEGLKGLRQVPVPESWDKTYSQLIESPLPEVRDLAVSLAVQFGDKRALSALEKIVTANNEPSAKRQAALETLLFQQKSELVPVLQGLLDDNAMRASAIKGLARFTDPKTPALILKRYGTLTEDEKIDAVHTLTSRTGYALALLDALEKKQVPRQDVSAFNARQLQALGNQDITERLTLAWGTIRPASEQKAVLMKKYKTSLTPEFLKKANLSRGRLLYQKTCAACHRLFDEGGNIGPELTGSQRTNLDYVLENMLDPSAIVAKDYQVTVLATADGRVISGIIKKENDKAVTVQTQNELIVLPRADIESRKLSPLSIMPDGQLDPLSMNEVRDLVAYLASPVQVPLPAEKK